MTALPLILAAIVGAKHIVLPPLVQPSGQKPVPFVEGSPITCELCYSAYAIFFVVRGPGEPAGEVELQVRPGARNPSAPIPPIVYRVYVKTGEGKDLLAPTAHTRETPHFPAKVEVQSDKAKGWAAGITLPFKGRIDKYWPICEGAKRPPTWFATVKYTDEAGKVTELGTADDPIQIGWGKTPTWKQARDELFKGDPRPCGDHDLVGLYEPARAKYCDIYDFSQKERWIGYLDPGIETFVWRQADSEKLFYNSYAAAIANEYDEALKLLVYRKNSIGYFWTPPKATELADPAKDRLVKMVDAMNYAADSFTAARLEYLRDRFMGRKVKDAAVFKAKKPKSAAANLKAPDANVEEGTMSLDDEELQF